MSSKHHLIAQKTTSFGKLPGKGSTGLQQYADASDQNLDGLPDDDPNYSADLARTGESPGDNLTPLLFHEQGPKAGQGQRVGWTLTNASGHVVAAMGFKINPQALDRQQTQRNQLHATKGGFYVDDFGPGPTTITMRQLVASGKELDKGLNGVINQYTARGDVQRFLDTIYQPVTTRPGRYVLRFHDNHYSPDLGGKGERIYLPSNALSVQRSVDLHNVWLLTLTMVSLEPQADGQLNDAPERATPNSTRRPRKLYIVKSGETLHSLVARLAGKKATSKHREALLAALLTLNPQVKNKRTETINGAPVSVAAFHLHAGERIVLPV